MARNGKPDESADKEKTARRSLQIDPRLKHRISASAYLGRTEKAAGPVYIQLSEYGGCDCGTHAEGTRPAPLNETSETREGYTTFCTEAELSLKLMTATLKDEGSGVRKWKCDINTQVLPNGDPPVSSASKDLNFSDANETIPVDLVAFDGFGGYCGDDCVKAVAHQVVDISGKDTAGVLYLGSTVSLQSVDADGSYSVEVLAVDPMKPMRRARLWLRFLVWKTC